MIDCDEILSTLLFGSPLDAAGEAHLASCARCGAERERVVQVRRALAADVVPAPGPGLTARVLRAAEPLLAHHVRHAAWSVGARALAVALVLLPVILFVDWQVVRAAHALLSRVLPGPLSLYLVFNYAATLALLLALTYSAIPILAERQARLQHRESHG